MPVASGDQGGGRKPPKVKGDNQVVRHNPVSVASTGALASQAAAAVQTPGNSNAPKGGKVLGGGKAPVNPYLAAQKAAASAAAKAQAKYEADQKKEARLTRDRYIEDAERLGGQVAALRKALGKDGAFRDALNTKLGNLDEAMDEQLGALEKGFGERWGSLDKDQQNNEIASGDSSVTNDTNRMRERTSALTEAALQGAGESDQLRSQLMSLRNWDSNQNEINRSYHDSARSIQNSRIDLVGDTRTAMQNVWYEADADKQQLWNDYHAQQSESYTALGNALGQQAEYYGLAKSAGAGGRKVSLTVSAGGGGKGGGKGGRGGRTGGAGSYDGGSNLAGSGPWGGPGRDMAYDPGSNVGFSGPAGGPNGMAMNGRPTVTSLTVPEDNREGKNRGKGKGKSKTNGWRDKRVGLGTAMEVSEEQSDRAFMRATEQIGMAKDSNGMPNRLSTWGDGMVQDVKPLPNSLLQSARTTIAQKAPEGATLRKW